MCRLAVGRRVAEGIVLIGLGIGRRGGIGLLPSLSLCPSLLIWVDWRRLAKVVRISALGWRKSLAASIRRRL